MRNQKWVNLAEKLKDAGWGTVDPRMLRRQYFAGRAEIKETNETTGDRTIYHYAIVWNDTRFGS